MKTSSDSPHFKDEETEAQVQSCNWNVDTLGLGSFL